jgi:hypothetical protein
MILLDFSMLCGEMIHSTYCMLDPRVAMIIPAQPVTMGLDGLMDREENARCYDFQDIAGYLCLLDFAVIYFIVPPVARVGAW